MERLAGVVDAERVVIAGALTNVAVKDAAFGFLSRGFSVTIAEDCCAATSKQNRKLAAEELRAAGCTICSSESVIMELASGCTKQVLDAVREILFS
jgi:nicotinamidase-related amidase